MDKQVSGWGMEVDPPETIHASGRVASVVGVRETIALVSRRRNFILSFVVASCILLIIAVLSMRDTYTAASALVLERNDTQMLEAVTQLDTEQRDRSAIETEMDIISSRVFAGRVVDAMNLVNHPWFNAYLVDDSADDKESTFPGYVLGAVGTAARSLFGLGETDSPPKLPSISVQRDSAISSLLGRLSVTRNGESLAVTVRISSPDAELSAAIANTVANVYVDWSRDLKKQAMSDAVSFLRERANQVASRIAENERAITDFSGLNHLASDERDDLLRKRIDEMNTQLTSARVELAGIRASREQGRRVIAGTGDLEGTALESPLLTTLRGEQAVLVRQRAQYASNFAAGHPQIVETDAQLASVAAMIDAEIQRIVDDLSGEEKVVDNRVVQLESQISELQTTVRQRSLAEIRLRELERDLLADQKLHDLVVARLGGLDPFAEVAKPSARVVSIAEVPTEPSFPQRGRVLAGGVVGATVLAIILAVMLEAIDNRIRSGQRISQVVHLRNLANIPRTRSSLAKRPGHSLRRLVERPRSTSAEAFRSLYLACRAQLPIAKAVVLVTAPLPGDGTTSVALGLAFSAANDGVKTLYIDLDLQPPPPVAVKDLNKLRQDLERQAGGTRIPVDAIQHVPGLDRLDVFRSARQLNRGQANPPMSSEDVRLLIEELRTFYELIVIDSAPVLIVEDANWLSPLVDAVLLVARFGRTTEQELIGTVSRLNLNRAPLIGTVLNCVDPRGRTIQEPLGAASYPRQARTYFID
jgi:polysaccharide biosynthesis transport protein